MNTRFIEIQQDSTLSCSDKLDAVQNVVTTEGDITGAEFDHIAAILKQCAGSEHQMCLETAFLISDAEVFLPESDMTTGLEAIGATDIVAVNTFIIQKICPRNRSQAYYAAQLVPHLYRGREDELTAQLGNWYAMHPEFVFTAVSEMLWCYLNDSSGHAAQDFRSELQQLQGGLERIAAVENVNPADAYATANDLVVKLSVLLDDIKWQRAHSVDWSGVDSNLSTYSRLATILNHNGSAISDLRTHNKHPLVVYLNPPIRDSQSDRLLYYDYCVELLVPGNGLPDDPVTRIRRDVLKRDEHRKTIAEIEVFNALRREFGVADVAIEEPTPCGKKPDAKLSTSGETIWVEVTCPDPHPSYEVADMFSFDMDPELSGARKYVTRKLDEQIKDVKESTDDLTMLVIKNEVSRLDEASVEDYVKGGFELQIPRDDDYPEVVSRTGRTGLQYDSATNHLDLLVHFSTVDDLGSAPFVKGQVANLTGVDHGIVARLADAFNLDILTPPP